MVKMAIIISCIVTMAILFILMINVSNQSSKNTKYPKATEYKKNNERSVKK